ncbi:MAG TPA: CsgG/HfaB family protein [Thermoanaerobaculia bacterium]|jgi:curli biogenesis system outer membrane secretion channel CsgG
MKSRWSIVRVMLICLVVVPSALVYASEKSGKPSVGVAEFTNETSAGWWYGGVGNDLAGMLTNELASTEKFRMVERAKLSHVLEEQDLGASGRVSERTAAKVGKLTGAKYLVMGNVSAYEEHSSGGGGGLSFHGIGIGGKKEDAYIAIDVRVVDTTTGEVEYTRTVEAKSTNYGIGASVYRGGVGGNFGKYENTPAGKAIRACLVEISDYLSCVMVDKDDCMNEYAAKEKARRDKTKKAIKIE